ncbi:hypothetical protein MMP64_08410 [Acinetobacter sp. ANC 5659]|uniref:hypothetical protein n=1 Tax=Acinetobacter higginsii TaxID=70347 RepID=UPI001F4B2C74|nr:hypothetical protein [Acinetobacter higginsii]MCH7317961.1 hypothetical protein [Acinetobacter higginsii]
MKLLPIILICSFGFAACSSPDNEKQSIKSQEKIDKEAEQYKKEILKQQQELADSDKPNFDWPKVNFSQSVPKVNINNDSEILKAVGKPIVDQEDSTKNNGESSKTYWFSKDLTSYLQIDLSQDFIDVTWHFDSENIDKSTATFKDGQKITRALLGSKTGGELYEHISEGMKYKELVLDDGVVVQNARCGQFVCRYKILR